MPIVNTFCFCGTLRQGAITSGFFTLIASIVTAGVGGWHITRCLNSDPEIIDREEEELRLAELIKGSTYVVAGVLIICMSILLLVALKINKKSMFLPWLIVIGLGIIGTMANSIWEIVQGTATLMETGVNIGAALQFLYLLIVVFSYYQSLQQCQVTAVYTTSHQNARVLPQTPIGYVPVATDCKLPQTTIPQYYPYATNGSANIKS